MAISATFIWASILTLYFVPKAVIDGALKLIFFYLNLLLIGCVLGIVFVAQSVALKLCKIYNGIILIFIPQD